MSAFRTPSVDGNADEHSDRTPPDVRKRGDEYGHDADSQAGRDASRSRRPRRGGQKSRGESDCSYGDGGFPLPGSLQG